LDAVVGRMMARAPEARPGSAAEVAKTLEPLGLTPGLDSSLFALGGGGSLVSLPGPPRHRGAWLNWLLAFLVAVVLVGGAVWLMRSAFVPAPADPRQPENKERTP